ncbi:hypothetical protein SLS63_011476 [Diaporthe eres]|uniref:Uncharacterized protein n=1 Tax=Diaporthe eres TaxID=83184 RepID=A0ABR1NU18_DIAER
MHQLVEVDGLRLEGLIGRGQFQAARAKAATTISVDVNVYGKREDAYRVGDILSSFGVYLQQPVCGLEQSTYYNPHFLHVEELLGLGPVQETPKFKFETKAEMNARGADTNSTATPVPEEGDARTEISNVLSSLTHHAILGKKAGTVALKSELKEHMYPGNMTFYKYHGRQRQQDANLLFERDVVFSTYATLASEPDRGIGILNSVEWFRIVLDEVFNLVAEHRWCLTGTPIQNSVEDLGALVSFLRVPLLDNPSTFRRYILNQAKHGSRNSFRNLKLLLSSICLRRTKDVAGMSDPVVQTRILSFDPAERQDYVGLLEQLRTHIDMDISGCTTGGESTRMLQGILKLRLFCNNGFMGCDASKMPLDADEVLSCLQQTGQASCVLCSRTIYSISSVPETDGGCPLEPCSHLACRDCAAGSSKKRLCPRCADGDTGSSIRGILQSMKELEAQDTAGADHPSQGPRYPSKLCAFVEDIQAQVAVKSLNLAVASRIYLLEPRWNPQLEQQAFGRAQRLGQTEQVTIIRYVMKDTVEEVTPLSSVITWSENEENLTHHWQSNVWQRQAKKLRDAARGFEKSGEKPGSGNEQDLRVSHIVYWLQI